MPSSGLLRRVALARTDVGDGIRQQRYYSELARGIRDNPKNVLMV
jgi:hypothetical protein